MYDKKTFKKQKKRVMIDGSSKGPIARQKGRGSIGKANILGHVQWTPAKRIIFTLLTAGVYAAIMISLYLFGVKELAIMFGAITMLIFLMTGLLYWMVKG